MSALSPGLYRATVESTPNTIIMVTDEGGRGQTMTSVGDPGFETYGHNDITDARPLIVLDFEYPQIAINALEMAFRDHTNGDARTIYRSIADQIEAQIKPARIPEPGWDGKVTASTDGNPTRRDFIRFSTDGGRSWDWCDGSRAASAWKYLIDPTLVREGVES